MSEEMVKNTQLLREYVLEQFKNNELEMIKKFPFLIVGVKTFTAEIRDWIIDNAPEQLKHVPKRFITQENHDKYVINMIKSGQLYSIGKMNEVSYKSLVLMLESGRFDVTLYTPLTDREKTRFVSAVVKVFKRRELSYGTLWHLAIKFESEILNYYQNTKKHCRSKNEIQNLYTFFSILGNIDQSAESYVIKKYGAYDNVINHFYFHNIKEIMESTNPAFTHFKYLRYKEEPITMNIICNYKHITNGQAFKKEMTRDIQYILWREGKVSVWLDGKKITVYANGYFKKMFVVKIAELFKINTLNIQHYITSMKGN